MNIRSGVSLVELVITMCIIATMVGGATMYYNEVIERTRNDKALSDLKQLQKVLMHYDSELPGGLTTYTQISESREIRDLRKLLEERLVPEMPVDPWGNDYRIDIEAGIIYSQGQDTADGYDLWRFKHDSSHVPPLPVGIEEAIANGGDDIILRYKPRFEPVRAIVSDERKRSLLYSVVNVDFTRSVDYRLFTTDTSFDITPASGLTVTTAIVDMGNSRKVKVVLDGQLIGGGWGLFVAGDGTVRAVDNTPLESDAVVPIARMADF